MKVEFILNCFAVNFKVLWNISYCTESICISLLPHSKQPKTQTII